MPNPFEGPNETEDVRFEDIELPPTNQVYGRDRDGERLKQVQNMFELYLAGTEVKEASQIPEYFALKGAEWREALETPEMQYAFQSYLTTHTAEDIEKMRDMEGLLVEFRKAAGSNLQ
ncbi:MAG: hypothetical protein ABI747_00805 [Candidatus Moraniibacteriota bacterium]